jgi:selenocysteine-specific elongation factor
MLVEGGLGGVETGSLPIRLGLDPASLGEFIVAADAERVGDRIIARSLLQDAERRLIDAAVAYLAQHQLDSGVQQAVLRSQLGASDTIFDELLRRAVSKQALELRDGAVRPSGWAPRLDDRHLATRAALLAHLTASGREPPSTQELVAQHGQQTVALLRILERERLVTSVEPLGARYYESQCLNQLVQEMQGLMAGGGEVTPAALRDALGMSRKFLIPFLEYCDRIGITERRGIGRVWAGGRKGNTRDVEA